MIGGAFYKGSGLGNQLHRYVASRVLAYDKGFEFAMVNAHEFKGSSFMDLEMGYADYSFCTDATMWNEKKVVENGVDIRGYDPEINFVKDYTIIDGEFQDERYWAHEEQLVDKWLKVEPLKVDKNVCAIGFRGGEFTVFPDLFLTKEYWDKAIEMMLNMNPLMKFEVHTDDPTTAQQFFPEYPVIHDIGINWRTMRYAQYAIIANSSFYILPRWLRKGVTIAPRYWARHNIGVWSMPQNYYKRFLYI